MWRRRPSSGFFFILHLRQRSPFSSSSPIPPLHSFLQPTIFPRRWPPQPPQPTAPPPTPLPPATTPLPAVADLHDRLESSLAAANTDDAWHSFKLLAAAGSFPSRPLADSLVAHLCSVKDLHSLKRAFTAVVLMIEKSPGSVSSESVQVLVRAFAAANAAGPALALVKSMFKNRLFVPFSVWGETVVAICRKNGSFAAFLMVFHENCRLAIEERLDCLMPDLVSCNAVLEGCCKELGSMTDAEKVLETMSALRVRPDAASFGHLAYLYAWKGREEKVSELEGLLASFQFQPCSDMNVSPRSMFYSSLISGYVKAGELELVAGAILRALGNREDVNPLLNEQTYGEVAETFIKHGKLDDLAKLILEAQKSEAMVASETLAVESSFGYGIVTACVNLGFLDKAHAIVEEMNALGGAIGLGVYVSILKAYCKEQRTTEAAQLVAEISSSGKKMDSSSYDALIDASIATQDFQSAFSLFRDMREARVRDLRISYLTIMTGLTEKHRPELMAAFLDEVVDDPRLEVGTHDWNSIIHAFCKLGRLEDGRRTLRRMVFLRHHPNCQTYLSLINGYVAAGTYFNVLMLWTDVKKKISVDGGPGIMFDQSLVEAFLYAFVKGGFFDAAMQVVEKSQELKIFVDKWRYKQAFMETHKKLRIQKLRRRNFRKMEALIAFKNWAGLNS